MKRLIFILTVTTLNCLTTVAQDIILKQNAEEIKAKVEEITDHEVKYKEFENLDGPTYTISKSDIFRIKFANGDIETFKDSETSDMNKQRYNIGDIYDENNLKGIIVYVTPDGEHGLITNHIFEHPSISYRDLVWCNKELTKYNIGLTNKDDGMVNMQILAKAIEANNLNWDDFPAFKRCLELGDGWYLPALNETEHIARVLNGGIIGSIQTSFFYGFNDKLRTLNNQQKKIKKSPYLSIGVIVSSTEWGEKFISYGYNKYSQNSSNLLIALTSTYYVLEKMSCDKYTKWENMLIFPVHKF